MFFLQLKAGLASLASVGLVETLRFIFMVLAVKFVFLCWGDCKRSSKAKRLGRRI